MQKTHLSFPISNSTLSAAEFEQYSSAWLLDCEIRQHSKNTIALRRGILDKFLWWLKEKDIGCISNLTMRQFLLYVTNGHKEEGGRWGRKHETDPVTPATVQLYHRHLRACLNWTVEEGGIEVNPMARVKPPIDRPDQIQPFTNDQVLSILAAAKKSSHPKRDYAICLFLLDSGLRVSEMCSLTMGSLDMPSRSATVEGKGGKKRSISFGAQTTKAVWSYLREYQREDGQHIFLSDRGLETGEALTSNGVLQMLHRLAARAELKNVRCSPHTFRHTFAINFLRNGGNQFTLMQILGHTDTKMTQRYVTFAEADVARQQKIYSPADRIIKGRSR